MAGKQREVSPMLSTSGIRRSKKLKNDKTNPIPIWGSREHS
jgi:hypothetical protein